jgi:DNA repair exonuclease SbcCD nuclease subunit
MQKMTNLFQKAAVFTDIHYGMRNNSRIHNEDCDQFIDWFIEQAKEKGCETCIFCGDWHHNRNSLNISTLKYSLDGLRKLSAAFEKVYFILGNHDLYYRETREVNSIEFLKEFPNVTLVDNTLVEGGVAFVSWLVGDEWKKVPRIKSKYMFGHFELPTFRLNAMVEMPDHGGLKGDMFANQDYVFTGHFHSRQVKDNVIYIGNAFPHNFADAWDDERGWMFLEWDKEPEFFAWTDAPKYKTIKLSTLLDNPEKHLLPKTSIRISLDINITYEEANYIKDNFLENYKLRDITLVPIKTNEHTEDVGAEIRFETIDEIVVSQLTEIDGSYDKKLLIQIYNNLAA